MQTLTMKIVDWDETTLSVIVKYSSDVNTTAIDDCMSVAIQPMSLFVDERDDVDQVLKRIAKTGIGYCAHLAKIERACLDDAKVDFFRNLKGQTLTFPVNDLQYPAGWDDEFYSGDLLHQTDKNITPDSL